MGRPASVYRNANYPFKVIEGDIFKVPAQAMAVPANSLAEPDYGLESVVYRNAGRDELLAERCEKTNGGELGVCQLLITGGHALKNEYLYHIVPPLNITNNYDCAEQLENCYYVCVTAAVDNGVKSIVFPLIGAHIMQFDVSAAYGAAKRGIENALIAKRSRSTSVTLVLDENAAYIIKNIELGKAVKPGSEKDRLVGIESCGREYATRISLMHQLFEKEQLSDRVYKELKKDREAFTAKVGTNTDNKFAAVRTADIMQGWVNDYTEKNGVSENAALGHLVELTNIDLSTVKNILRPDGRMKNNVYVLPNRETKIALAVAMGLDAAKRIEFIIADSTEYMYPSDFQDGRLEEVLSKLGENADFDTINLEYNENTYGEYSLRLERTTGRRKEK